MSALLLDSIVDKHAIDIEPDYLKVIKVNCISYKNLWWHQLSYHSNFEAILLMGHTEFSSLCNLPSLGSTVIKKMK